MRIDHTVACGRKLKLVVDPQRRIMSQKTIPGETKTELTAEPEHLSVKEFVGGLTASDLTERRKLRASHPPRQPHHGLVWTADHVLKNADVHTNVHGNTQIYALVSKVEFARYSGCTWIRNLTRLDLKHVDVSDCAAFWTTTSAIPCSNRRL